LEKPARTYFPAVTSFFQDFTSFWHSFDIQPEESGSASEREKNNCRALELALAPDAMQPN